MSITALLLLDLQKGILDRFPDAGASYLTLVSSSISAARTAGLSIIYVTTSFRPGHPELSPLNLSASRIASFGGAIDGSPGVQICSQVAPLETDILVTKRRVSAFSGSDLDVVLRGLGVQRLVVAGVATSGAVLSTVRQAADLDYGVTVVKDLCLDPDEEVQRVLVEKVFPRQARTVSTEEWIGGLGGSGK